MIRRSTVIATVAILASLLFHLLGLSFTSHVQPEQPTEDLKIDAVAMGNAFEDVAEALSEPVQSELTPVPDPPVETIPEPERAVTPTSKALVASPDPQPVATPDTVSAKVVQPATVQPSEPEVVAALGPETVGPSSGDERTTTDAAVTSPVEPDTISEVPKGNPDTSTEPAEAVAVEPMLSPSIDPALQPDVSRRLAALPVPVAPTLPVTPVPEPSSIPIISLERELVDPATPEITIEPVPDDPEIAEAEEVVRGSDLAVVTSLRPRLPKRRPSADASGASDGSEALNDLLLAPSQLIESPLTTYQRDGIDLFGGARRSGRDSRSSGNSDVTDYNGRVLIHLNRAPAVHVSARGFARVLFQINPDGSLAWVDIIDGSGSQKIDSAAKAQVRSAAPFPPPPQGISRKLVFVYRIN